MPSVVPIATSSLGVSRELFPLPPATKSPRSAARGARPSLSAPHTVVVTPLECQSKPRTQPNAWNQRGSDRRSRNVRRPRSITIASTIAGASCFMRPNSHAGARPLCSGRSALPVRVGITTVQRHTHPLKASVLRDVLRVLLESYLAYTTRAHEG